jgi:signal transduction histidine kinase
VRVTVAAAGGRAQIKVSDTGIGIDPAHHARIFDRFYRVSTDRGEVGAGLGLAIVRSICHAHGGTVTISSAIGKGSSFVVDLPSPEWKANPRAHNAAVNE